MTFGHFLDIIIALLVISNPLILAETMIIITLHRTSKEKKEISFLASTIGCAILIAMVWIGPNLLHLLGLTMSAFQMAGGIVVMVLGFAMLNAKTSAIETPKEEIKNISLKSMAIIPLAFPLLAGPGAISTVIVYTNRYPGAQNAFIISLACLILSMFCYCFMHSASFLEKKLGRSAIHIFGRVGGLILLTLGIQIFLAGSAHYFPSITLPT